MRLVETVQPAYGPVRRPYVRLVVRGTSVLAIVDSGADTSSIDERTAARIGLPYTPAGVSSGIGGEVTTFRAAPAVVAILGPRARRGWVEWVEIGSNELKLNVLRAPSRLPALVGRADLLVHYRFVLLEAEGAFELTPKPAGLAKAEAEMLARRPSR